MYMYYRKLIKPKHIHNICYLTKGRPDAEPGRCGLRPLAHEHARPRPQSVLPEPDAGAARGGVRRQGDAAGIYIYIYI